MPDPAASGETKETSPPATAPNPAEVPTNTAAGRQKPPPDAVMASSARRNLTSFSAPMPQSTPKPQTPMATPIAAASAHRQASSAPYSRSVRWARKVRSTSCSGGSKS